MKVLIFDTETTDKAKNFKLKAEEDLNNYPDLLQLTCILYKYKNEKLVELDCLNTYVKPYRTRGTMEVPIKISEGSIKIHGITFEKAKAEGRDISEVLEEFQNYLKSANIIAAHNLHFDRNVMVSEFLRRKEVPRIDKNSITVCTMKGTKDILKLPGKYGDYKWPSLQELHEYCYGEGFDNAHDSKVDVEATARCLEYFLNRGELKNMIEK